jgi:hypothetical protein
VGNSRHGTSRLECLAGKLEGCTLGGTAAGVGNILKEVMYG